MKIRLQITTSPDSSTTFEHAGPTIRIGRSPDCELALQGDAAEKVSRNHTRIELGRRKATVVDDGSRNGTLLNDQPVTAPRPLRVGDRIQLGYTGPTLTVLELDLKPEPAAAGSAKGGERSAAEMAGWAVSLGVGAVVLAGLALVLPGLLNRGKGDAAPTTSEVTQAATRTEVTPPPPPVTGTRREEQGETVAADKEPIQEKKKPDIKVADAGKRGRDRFKPPPPPKTTREQASTEVRDLGRYVALEKWGPSVLLQRRGEGYPWAPLPPEARVGTAQPLVSLPGYRSVLALDGGVDVTLWGNVPEFSAFPPVLESVAVLNVPEAGSDVDLTLDRGRVVFANRKPSGAAQVRLRFLGEVWDLTLLDRDGAAAAELWSAPPTPNCLGLFTRGRVRVKTSGQQLDLTGNTRVAWVSGSSDPLTPVPLPELPDWWAKEPARDPRVEDAMISLLDWADRLRKCKDDLTDAVLTRVKESPDAKERELGTLFLAAMEATPHLVDLLEFPDPKYPMVRGTAAHALRLAVGRGGDQPALVERLLADRRSFTKEKVGLIMWLCRDLSRQELGRPDTYQKLIGLLDHENLAVRELAYLQLASLVPEGVAGAKKIEYSPVDDAEQRRKSVEQWKRLVPPGRVPITLADGPDTAGR